MNCVSLTTWEYGELTSNRKSNYPKVLTKYKGINSLSNFALVNFLNAVTQIQAELKQQGTNWSGMARAAQNRVRWRGVVDGLAPPGAMGISTQNQMYNYLMQH